MKKIITCLLLIFCVNLISCGNKLSDDLYSFEVKIEGKKYFVPFTLGDLTKNDWLIPCDKNRKTIKVSAHDSELAEIHKNDTALGVIAVNSSDKEMSLEECRVRELSIYVGEETDNVIDIELPKGIKTTSTKEEIKEAYGEPTEIKDDIVDGLTFIYEFDMLSSIEFMFKENSNTLDKIVLENDNADIRSNRGKDTTSSYKAPDRELGDDISSKNYEFDGAVYTVHSPVKEFISNGWLLQNDVKEKIDSRGTVNSLVLRKDNKTIKVDVGNYTDKKVSIEECHVLEVSVRADDKISMKLPNGVQIGSKVEDVDKAFEGLNVEKGLFVNDLCYKYKTDDFTIECLSDDHKIIDQIEVRFYDRKAE